MVINPKRITILLIISILSIIICSYIYKREYINSYRNILLEQICQCKSNGLKENNPHWMSIASEEQIKNIEQKYEVDLSDIDINKYMVIISFGAELKHLDYNLRESTYKTRKQYIGFPVFDSQKEDMIFFYKSPKIPIIDTDTAGFAPDYKGKYRK